ncbi:phage repressor protein CI [Hafnia paralvei]|uniref:phage repressor protein CI n=1 Tax=Hafnia paralvei TaxID=546367 RepID=UPI001D12093E|nr:phage repressor protein CI [Hafnia paralvei]
MTTDSRDVTSVLERVLSAYGFTMQKELSEKLGIASNNISSWLKRGSVPASVLVQCAMDTGSDVTWLVTGEFAKSNLNQNAGEASFLSGKALHEKILSSGGKPVLKRILDAYGFDTQKELADYLDIPTATISTWVRRDYFPGDVVIACALQTGKPLTWLATGDSSSIFFNDSNGNRIDYKIKRYQLVSGHLELTGDIVIDPLLISSKIEHSDLFCVEKGNTISVIHKSNNEVSNGSWLLDVDGSVDIYNVSKRPAKKISLSNLHGEFVCEISDVSPIGVAVVIIEKII